MKEVSEVLGVFWAVGISIVYTARWAAGSSSTERKDRFLQTALLASILAQLIMWSPR